MRFKLYFELEKPNLSIQYRKSIISFIKHSIQEYDELLFDEIYEGNKKKTFTWAAILSKPKFNQENIELQDNNFSIIFSAYNYLYGLHIYNAVLKQKHIKFSLNQNSMTLKNIVMIPEKQINSEKIIIKTVNPILVRNHDRETLKDMYYSFDRAEFEKYLKINILEQMKQEKLDSSLLEGFKIRDIQAKKVIVKLYEKKIETSVGIFEIEGKKELLKYLYMAGIGSKKAMRLWIVRNNINIGGEKEKNGRNNNKSKRFSF